MTIDIIEPKLFGKWTYEDVNCSDLSLKVCCLKYYFESLPLFRITLLLRTQLPFTCPIPLVAIRRSDSERLPAQLLRDWLTP